ncbi:MAG: hypothetical protein K1X82_04055 [Bacteroidia bacterium]|nr:hypothetical protein [Bacteroidia bacterium]
MKILFSSPFRKTLVFLFSCLTYILLAAMLFSSCSSQGHVRKCDGSRGTRVPMGVL